MKNRHWLMMAVCVLGMGALVALALPGVRAGIGGRLGGSWVWLMALLCPLSHILMMRGMNHGQGAGDCHVEHQAKTTAAEPAAGSEQAQ
ncbi:MAG: DUF2933 domain-containing protein [Chloroflexota bacterium]